MTTTTTVINLGIQNRPAGTRTFDAPQPVPANLLYATLELPMNDADKLAATGSKSLTIQSWFSPDNGVNWVFTNGTTWSSYGPNGLTVKDPDGTTRVNPNPRIQVPLSNHTGELLRCQVMLPQSLQLGVLVTVTGP